MFNLAKILVFMLALSASALVIYAQEQPKTDAPKEKKTPVFQVKYKGGEDFTGSPPIRAFITLAGKTKETSIVGWNKEKILCSENAKGVPYKFSEIEAAYIVLGNYEEFQVQRLENQKKWKEAYTKILEAFQDFLPYVELNDNNVVKPLFRAGRDVMESAKSEAAKSSGDKLSEAAIAEYKKAQGIFDNIARAQWWPESKLAQVKAILCILAVGKLEEAAEKFEAIPEPEIGDVSYGAFWMVKGKILYDLKKKPEALDAAIKSIVYADKDIDSFPDALLITAQCYEDNLDYHRARDTYLQVASLFQKTDWGDNAFKRLSFIMEKGLAKKKEDVDIEKVFFDSEEDMDALATKFIKETLGGQKEKTEPRKTDKKEKTSGEKSSDKKTAATEKATEKAPAEEKAPAGDKPKPAETKGK